MDKEKLLALCMKHAVVEFPGEDKSIIRISLDDLAKVVDSIQAVPEGTLVVQHDRIHFGGGIALYPAPVERAAKRLAMKLFEAQESRGSRTSTPDSPD
ncbi:hypothetical protein AB4Y45_34870 [Paraburkholderia sp. EG287A]|uniref:hypothetical protein n=1 Tax=Paraburkholderia sp. EG287A TaxID=3237012 RepID=UPI0034D2E37F